MSSNVCTICEETLPSAKDLEQHILSHSRHIIHFCRACKLTFQSRSDSENHVYSHMSVCYQCTTCSYKGSTTDFEQHSINCHSELTDARIFLCGICTRESTEESVMKNHLLVHVLSELQYKCSKCAEVFREEEGFLLHHKEHFDNLCNVPPEDAVEEMALEELPPEVAKKRRGRPRKAKKSVPPKIEDKVQKISRDYNCDDCNVNFSSFSALKKHILQNTCQHESEHSDNSDNVNCIVTGKGTDEKVKSNHKLTTYCCSTCEKNFRNPSKLKEHEVSHQKERSYQCVECSKLFKTARRLSEHMLVHSKVRQHKCSLCDNRFTLAWQVRRHMKMKHSSTDSGGVTAGIKAKTETRPPVLKVEEFHSNDPGFIIDRKQRVCKLCSMEFKSTPELRQHMRKHQSSRPFSCNICDKSFKSLYVLNDHKFVHSKEKQFACPVCKERFTVPRRVTRHMKVQHKGVAIDTSLFCKPEDAQLKPVKEPETSTRDVTFSYACVHCTEKFPDADTLQDHLHECHVSANSNHKCTICTHVCVTEAELTDHMTVHTTTDELFKCEDCPREYKQQRQLEAHRRKAHGWMPSRGWTDGMQYMCEICSKTFPLQCKLNAHMMIHGERKYCCHVCGDKFYSQGTLKVHLYKHTTDKPFKCSVCSKSFTARNYLKDHMTRHTNEKKYICSMCGNRYHCLGSLGLHTKLKHSSTKMHCCHLCPAGFNYKFQLDKHIYSHTGIKSFLCQTCGKDFIQEKALKLHSRLHTGQKLHKCAQCDKTFFSAYKLKRHTSVHERNRRTYNTVPDQVQQHMEPQMIVVPPPVPAPPVPAIQEVANKQYTVLQQQRLIPVHTQDTMHDVNHEMLTAQQSDDKSYAQNEAGLQWRPVMATPFSNFPNYF